MRGGSYVVLAGWLLCALTFERRGMAGDPIAKLFEDGAEPLLKQMTNPGGDTGGQGFAEAKDVFSGTTSLRITDYQRYARNLDGWNHPIREKPKAGEYRYLRFAWKKSGGQGIMIQLHDEKDWNIRYVAGANPMGWAAKSVADKEPADWTVVTCDLFQDFGECTLQGMALTSFAGVAHFDHIYLARSIDELDRIDVVGLRRPGKSIPLAIGKLETLWSDLASRNEANVYRAVWTLAASPDDTLPFLKAKLPDTELIPNIDAKQLRQWIQELDHEKFSIRERATKELKKHLAVAVPLLRIELQKAQISAETNQRILQLLKLMETKEVSPEQSRLGRVVRVLEYMETQEARKLLEALAKNDKDLHVATEAQLALERLTLRK